MKICYLSEMLLYSPVEKRAKRVQFDRKMTVIKGGNTRGKSVILKSIYWAFGADPAVVHQSWKNAHAIVVVRFNIDGNPYQILRRDKLFALFHGDGRLIGVYTSVTLELAPAVARLFDFGLQLTDNKGKARVLPPAYLFLPFYVDQDKSWSATWHGFKNLGQFSGWKKAAIQYHLGVRNNEYYRLTGELQEASSDLEQVSTQLNVLHGLIRDLRAETDGFGLNLSLEAFNQELNELLAEVTKLRDIEEALKASLSALHSERALVHAQVAIVDRAMRELSADFDFATSAIPEETVSCPTCGAGYENSFVEQFTIAEDEHRLSDFLVDLVARRNNLDARISDTNERFLNHSKDLTRVQTLLAAKQGDLTLKDILRAEGRAEFRETFRRRMTAGYDLVRSKDARVDSLRKSLKENNAESLARRRTIHSDFNSHFKQFARDLGVDGIVGGETKPEAPLNETGSQTPRAHMAYYYAILHVMRVHSPSAFCPIIIDSPNQQGQDAPNLDTLLRFIRDSQPEESQVILGAEDLRGVDIPGTHIVLDNEKRQLLNAAEYEAVASDVTPLLNRIRDATSI